MDPTGAQALTQELTPPRRTSGEAGLPLHKQIGVPGVETKAQASLIHLRGVTFKPTLHPELQGVSSAPRDTLVWLETQDTRAHGGISGLAGPSLVPGRQKYHFLSGLLSTSPKSQESYRATF